MADNVACCARGLLERGQGFIIENPRIASLGGACNQGVDGAGRGVLLRHTQLHAWWAQEKVNQGVSNVEGARVVPDRHLRKCEGVLEDRVSSRVAQALMDA
jgi:hypothetical protein